MLNPKQYSTCLELFSFYFCLFQELYGACLCPTVIMRNCVWMCQILMDILFVQKEAGIPKKTVKVEDIPGLSKFISLPLVINSLLSICFFTFVTCGEFRVVDDIFSSSVLFYSLNHISCASYNNNNLFCHFVLNIQ